MLKIIFKKLSCKTGIPIYFLRQIQFELRMMVVRFCGLLPTRYLKLKQLHKEKELKLHFGCGKTRYLGWVNIDSFFAKHVDLVLDLRRLLPFKNESVAFCYSEHFFEHFYPEEGRKHLLEVYRVLKPGGIYRLVVPAGIRFVEKYLNSDQDFFKLAFPWEERPMDAVYNILNWNGEHKNIFDFSQLEYLGKQAGFVQVRESQVNDSDIAVLRIDKSDPQRVAESLYVEMIKAL